jgi:hypothetical protein
MIPYKKLVVVFAAMATGLTAYNSSSANPDVPANITTPDLVKTKTVGDLKFKDGYPSDETMTKVQQYMYIQRAVNVFIDGIPVSSMQAMLEGGKSLGCGSYETS